MGKRMLSLCMALALCLGLLPATALAAGGDWEHTDHTGWTELTATQLNTLDYRLSSGNYYFSASEETYYFLDLTETITIPQNENVVLCLHNVYCGPALDENYQPSCDVAIKIEQGGTLTICDCSPEFDFPYLGGSGSMGENGAAIENHGTLNIISGTIGYGASAPAIDNKEGATLNLCGTPYITEASDGPHITSAGTISASYNGIPYTGDTIVIEYTGETDGTVVTNVTADNSSKFLGPGNTAFAYDSESGNLTFGTPVELGSLLFAGQAVADGVPYNVTNSSSEDTSGTAHTATLVAATEGDDYNLLWDEETKTLTLNNADIVASVDTFSNQEDGLFSIASENGITVNLIGENTITVYSHYHGIERAAYGLENTAGGVIVDGEEGASLKISMHPGTNNTTEQEIAAISAEGTVENKANLTVSGEPGSFTPWAAMTGVSSDAFQNEGTFTANISDAHEVYAVQTEDFTNTGTFTANISDASTACALSTGDFANSGTLDVDFTDVGTGVGVLLAGDGSSFTNSGEMDIDIPAAGRAQGILRYSASGEAAEDNFTWTNTADGEITIQVGNQGAAAAAFGGGSLAGLDLRSDGDITFTNEGDLTVTAASDKPANLSQTNWPSWQYFDTFALGLMPGGTGTVSNTGTMTLNAHNGYTAGLYVAGVEDTVSITNSGELNITTTTKGGENIRSVGLYAQLMQITETEAQQLPFDTTGGKVTISTTAAEGSQVDSDKLMAICLVQTFTGTAPEATDDFQQIEEEGIALSGEPVVLDPVTTTITTSGDEITQTHIINTIGTVNADGTVTPSTGMTALPALPGTVTIEGNPQVGDTLTAQVSNLPGGVTVAYQWQSADSQSGPFTAIAGATGESYTLTNNELGKYIQVVVTPEGDSYGGTLTATTSQPVARPYSPPANPNYKITVEPTEHGAVTAPTSAKQGTEVTLTPTPDEGFDVGTVTVTDRFGDAVEVTANPDGTYTFTMPNGQVTVEVTFVESQPEPLPFTDVAESDWFYDAVRYAYENGLMGGVGDNLFAPNNPTTRAQLVTILYRLEGEPAVTGQSPFTDVEPDTWYTDAVAWAAEEGIVNGVSATQFAPGNNITREQLATILFRYAQAKGYDVSARADLSGFPDAGDILPYAQEAMAWAVAEGLLQGFEDDTLRPQGNATRAQIATILMRFCEGVVE